MYNDDSNRQQNGFVRRPIPNKYNGGTDKPDYQSGGQGYGSYGGGYRQNNDGGQSSYARPQRRYNEGYGSNTGGNTGGYRSGGYSGGYNRNNNYGGQNDRLARQNDIIIKLLKDIRDRLPVPPGMETPSYGSDDYKSSYSRNNSYSGSSYSGSSSYSDGNGDEASFEPEDGGNEQVPPPASDAASEDSYNGQEDEYNS